MDGGPPAFSHRSIEERRQTAMAKSNDSTTKQPGGKPARGGATKYGK